MEELARGYASVADQCGLIELIAHDDVHIASASGTMEALEALAEQPRGVGYLALPAPADADTAGLTLHLSQFGPPQSEPAEALAKLGPLPDGTRSVLVRVPALSVPAQDGRGELRFPAETEVRVTSREMFTASDGTDQDRFGIAVAFHADTAVIGAEGDDQGPPVASADGALP